MINFYSKLSEVLSSGLMQQIQNSARIAFHTVGDTGGIGYAVPQQIVDMHMESDFNNNDPSSNPAFLYHLEM